MGGPSTQSPYRLLVEGTDDKNSVIHLLASSGYRWDDDSQPRPFVQDMTGVDCLLSSLDAHIKTHKWLGVVLDADDDIESRWKQLRDRFRGAGILLPDAPDRGGVVVEANGGRIARAGIWLMPDNALTGSLEHFLERLVPTADPVLEHARSATDRAIELGARLAQRQKTKGMLHAWLAWQEDPGIPFGTALKAKLFACDSTEAKAFVAWFRRLFDA